MCWLLPFLFLLHNLFQSDQRLQFFFCDPPRCSSTLFLSSRTNLFLIHLLLLLSNLI